MAPYSQRRHRLNPGEIEPVRDAALERLLRLLRDMDPLALGEAQSLFRIWYRIAYHVRSKPSYPPHETWSEIAIWMEYGEDSLDAYGTEKEGRVWCSAPRGAQPTRPITEAEAKAPRLHTKISGARAVKEETDRLRRRDDVE